MRSGIVSAIAGLSMLAGVGTAEAAEVTIHNRLFSEDIVLDGQLFTNADLSWKIVTNTSNPNLAAGNGFQTYEAEVFFSSNALGLSNIKAEASTYEFPTASDIFFYIQGTDQIGLNNRADRLQNNFGTMLLADTNGLPSFQEEFDFDGAPSLSTLLPQTKQFGFLEALSFYILEDGRLLQVMPFNSGPGFVELSSGNPVVVGELTISIVPIPAAFPLLLTALTGLSFLSWRRRKETFHVA